MGARLGPRDYQRMLDLAVVLLDTREPADYWSILTDELNTCLRGTVAMFNSNIHPAAPDAARGLATAPANMRLLLADRARLRQEHVPRNPFIRHFIVSGDRAPRTVRDVVDRCAWRRTSTDAYLRRELGVTDQIVLPLPSDPKSLRAIWIGRGGPGFGDRDQELLCQVQPLLTRIDRHFVTLERILHEWVLRRPAMDAADALRITARELTVLVLMADGLTAAAIGRRLAISPHTVVKHQSNIYRKLRAQDRLTAVLQAQRCGLLPPIQ